MQKTCGEDCDAISGDGPESNEALQHEFGAALQQYTISLCSKSKTAVGIAQLALQTH